MSDAIGRTLKTAWAVLVALALTVGAAHALQLATAEPCGSNPWQIEGICPDEDRCRDICRDLYGNGYSCMPDGCCECEL